MRGDLPPEAEVPIINIESADSQFASAYLSFSSEFLKQNEITDYLVRVVQPRLSAIEGVQRADILGARTFAMRIWLKPDRMAALNVSPAQVRQALAANNYLAAVGQTKGSLVQVNLTANTDLRSVQEFQQLVVREQDGRGGPARRRGRRGARRRGLRRGGQLHRPDRGLHRHLGAAQRQLARRDQARPHRDGRRCRRSCPSRSRPRIAYDGTTYIQNAIDEVEQTLAETLLIVVRGHLPLPRLAPLGAGAGGGHPGLAHRRRLPDAGSSASR